MSKNADELFEDLIKVFVGDSKVSRSKMFGSPGLKIRGKVFAFLMKGQLILKLPKERVDELVAAKAGDHFGHMFAPDDWRPMKEWVDLKQDSKKEWLTFAKEARDFVLSKV